MRFRQTEFIFYYVASIFSQPKVYVIGISTAPARRSLQIHETLIIILSLDNITCSKKRVKDHKNLQDNV